MIKKLKSLSDIANLHDLRVISRTRKSAKPQLPTSAILDLYMARNERDRLVKERMRLAKRGLQIDRRLLEINKEMNELLERARNKAAEIRDEAGLPEEIKKYTQGRSKKMVLEY